MTKRILIDAAHQEETRVALVVDSHIEEYVSESSSRAALKGNIYLGRITRIEPSLQAAFVDYGGSRHGFISFHDIHPDYCRIPVSDREEEAGEEDALADGEEAEGVSEVGGDGVEEGFAAHKRRRKSWNLHREYKIQEVLGREKPLLVQVIKEERGTKGAALSTYLSLAGRCCVLIPNSTRSGGISRRIEDPRERKRLREVVRSLEVPESMSVIVRTAVKGLSKQDIVRDYEYLRGLWESVRQRTLVAKAPALIHEEGDLILRTLRDMYTGDVEDIVVSGKTAFESAREAMGRLSSTHRRRIKQHKSSESSLFQEFGIEDQISAIYRPRVGLPSGGHIVLQQTEALVSIDVNSGKATRERHIEETALTTNLEAAESISRQLRLRDLAGLIVVDFIDMESSRSKHEVERLFSDHLSVDRARIQMGRISHFNLLELSRQRLHPTLTERAGLPCGSCGGTGYVPARGMVLLGFLRLLEECASKSVRGDIIELRVVSELGLTLLNEKREALLSLEEGYGVRIVVVVDAGLRFGESKLTRMPGESSDARPSSSSRVREARPSSSPRVREARPSSSSRVREARPSSSSREREDAPSSREREDAPSPREREASPSPREREDAPSPREHEDASGDEDTFLPPRKGEGRRGGVHPSGVHPSGVHPSGARSSGARSSGARPSRPRRSSSRGDVAARGSVSDGEGVARSASAQQDRRVGEKRVEPQPDTSDPRDFWEAPLTH